MYENLITGMDGRDGGLEASALAAVLAAPRARRHLVFVAGTRTHTGRGSIGHLHLELTDPRLPSRVGGPRAPARGRAGAGPVDDAAVECWQERHPESAASGTH